MPFVSQPAAARRPRFWVAVAALLLVPAAHAATITVTTTGDELNTDGDCSLREAVAAANADAAVDACAAGSGADTVAFGLLVTAGTFSVTGGQLDVTGPLTVNGGLTPLLGVTVDGDGSSRLFRVAAATTLTLRNLTLTGGTAATGGAVLVEAGGTLTLDAVTATDNTATGAAATEGGGAVYAMSATVAVTGSTFTTNRATGMAGSGGALFTRGGTASVTGSTFTGNTASRAGGGVETNAGTVTMDGVTFTANTAGPSPGNGGALHVTGMGTVRATGGMVMNNTATREGGGFWNETGTMTLTGTTFQGNSAAGPAADDGGGALFNNGGTMVLNNVTAVDNAATGAAGSGGGLFNFGGVLRVRGGLVDGNTANRAGAGIENATGPTRAGATTLTDVTVTDNLIVTAAPGNGGGLHSGGGTVTVRGGTFMGNRAAEGGGLWSNANMTLAPSDSTGAAVVVTGNVANGNDATQGGGGVFVETGGNVRLTRVTLNGNQATGTAGSGGGLFVADGSATVLEGGTVSGNTANRAGAGIEVADDTATSNGTALVVLWATVDGNTITTAAPGNGGGLHVGGAGVVTIRKSTFSNNAAREGAGLWIAGTSTLDLALSTVSGNDATQDGGGVYDNGGATAATITLTDVTVVDNTAGGIGGGLLSESPDGVSYTVRNTIVANNTAPTGTDCSGQIRSGGYNLFETTTGCTITGQTALDLTGLDPMLGPLANNGGPTLTHEPLAGSPAVDAGQSDFKVDQRDFLRAVGQEDIGAVERGAQPVTPDEEGPTGAFVLGAPSPNPARGATTVRFTLAEAAPAVVTLHDLLGRTVATLYNADAPAGAEQTVRVEVSGLAPGVYVVRLVGGGQTATGRLTVIR